jgi:hypothetical protein
MSVEDVVKGYTEALLWSNTYHYVIPSDDESMEPELEQYGSAHLEFDLDDFSADDQYEIRQMVREFVESNAVDYRDYLNGMARFAYLPDEMFGHDLLLTRSGHGAGFWDRGLGELGDRLSEAARAYGSTSAEIVNGKPVLVES